MGGPKVPKNYKDQEKIQAKIDEWETEAEGLRPEYPLANTVGQWTMNNKDNRVVITGTGAFDLISALVRFDKDITALYGFEIRTRLKGAFIETITQPTTQSLESIPAWLWGGAQEVRLFDPIDMLLAGHKERLPLEQLLEVLSCKARSVEDIRRLAPTDQAAFVYDFCQKLRLEPKKG